MEGAVLGILFILLSTSFGFHLSEQSCYHVVPSGSQILETFADNSVSLWNAETLQKQTIHPCSNNDQTVSFSILSYETTVNYKVSLRYTATTQVPMSAPTADGQVFHIYTTAAQPLVANDTSSFQGLEMVLQFGSFLNGPGFSDQWSIRGWYWNSAGINIVTPGIIVNPGSVINTDLVSVMKGRQSAIGKIAVAGSEQSQMLSMTLTRPITWCVSTVEMNDLNSCAGYPPENSMSWSNISIASDEELNPLPYLWAKQESSPSCGLQFYSTQNGQQTTFNWNSSAIL